MPTPVGVTKNTFTGSAVATYSWSRACAVGNTLVLFVQHQGTNQITVADNSSGTNVWTKVASSFDYSTPANGQLLVSVWTCTPTVAISTINLGSVGATATYWVLQAKDMSPAQSVRSSNYYRGGSGAVVNLSANTGDTIFTFFGYAATTAGTQEGSITGYTNDGLNNFSTTQSELWERVATTTGTQGPNISISKTVGAVSIAMSGAANAAPTASLTGATTVAANSGISLTGAATDDTAVTSLTVVNTTAPSGVTPLTMSGTASGLNTTSASITSTATPTVPGTYVFTITAGDGSLTTTATQTTYVTGATVGIDSVSSNAGGFAKFGTVPDIPTALSDNDDTTGISAASGSGGNCVLLAKPLAAGSLVTLTYKADCLSGTPSTTLTVALMQGATVVETRTDTLSTTTTTYVLTVQSGNLSKITDRTALTVSVTYT